MLDVLFQIALSNGFSNFQDVATFRQISKLYHFVGAVNLDGTDFYTSQIVNLKYLFFCVLDVYR